MVLESLDDGASGFVGMRAVGESTSLRHLEYLGEVAADFLGLHVERSESLDARRIDVPSACINPDHLAVGGGVHACVVGFADGCRAQPQAWHHRVQQR